MSFTAALLPVRTLLRRWRRRRGERIHPHVTNSSPTAPSPSARHATATVSSTEHSAPWLLLSGDIDVNSRLLLSDACRDLLATCTLRQISGSGSDIVAHQPQIVTIDATDLTFIDAAGLGLLVTLSVAVSRLGIAVTTVHAPRGLRRLSGICDLDGLLGIARSGDL